MNPITLNYSEITQAFMSFMTSRPKWYLDFGGKYYSIDANNVLRLHNSNSKYNVLSTIDDKADVSKIKIIVNDNYETTKTFDNVSYSADFASQNNLSNITFKTNTQNSLTVQSIDRREDTYKFAIPRNSSLNKFADRMRGKYLVSNYEFNDLNGSKFTLPYIKTTYRYSMI
jgi:hypothetical protein